MRALILLAVGLVWSASLLAASQKASAKVDAVEVYKINCQACHGPDGSMPPPLSFADSEWKHGSRLQDVTKVIADGIDGSAMLPFKEKLTKAEIAALARLVRSFDKSLAEKKPKSGPKPVKSHD